MDGYVHSGYAVDGYVSWDWVTIDWAKLKPISMGYTSNVPAFNFGGDSNTGLYMPGADRISVSVGGVSFIRSEEELGGDDEFTWED